MRISELARATGVPLATVKFYLREGLLPEGVRTSATQATYGEAHAARLRLIRALLDPGGLSIAAIRQVLDTLDDPPSSGYELICAAGAAIARPGGRPVDHTRLHALLSSWGVPPATDDCRHHDDLASALAALDETGFELPPGALDHYRAVTTDVARGEIDAVPTGSAEAAVRYVVLGTILVEPLLLALRRLAHRELTARRFG